MPDRTPRCSFCGGENLRAPQAYCHQCHADYQRDWRAVQKKKHLERDAQLDSIRTLLATPSPTREA